MSRRHSAAKREIMPDSKYGSLSLSKFVNCLMIDGKKSITESIIYNALESLEEKQSLGTVYRYAFCSNYRPMESCNHWLVLLNQRH